MSEINVQQAVPFFEVSDMQESLRFYVEGLGFSLADQWVDKGRLRWCRLELGEAAIMLQESDSRGDRHLTPRSERQTGVVIYFICHDALTIFRDARSRGIDMSRPFVGNHMWVTGVLDPDGYRLEFESATVAPEGSVLPDKP